MRGRRPKWAASRRYHLTLEAAEADILDAYAEDQRKPVATVAAQLLSAALHRATSVAEDELADAQRQLEQLRSANAGLRRRLSEADVGAEQEPPRWERPLADLISDRDWWSAWLPRLYQLLGRPAYRYPSNGGETVDERGYRDLMNYLFPPIHDRGGRVVAQWNSPYYADHARRVAAGDHPSGGAVESAMAPARPAVWEPVIRHVAVALCALETTAMPGASPELRLRMEKELAGGWLLTLRRLVGADTAELPVALT